MKRCYSNILKKRSEYYPIYFTKQFNCSIVQLFIYEDMVRIVKVAKASAKQTGNPMMSHYFSQNVQKTNLPMEAHAYKWPTSVTILRFIFCLGIPSQIESFTNTTVVWLKVALKSADEFSLMAIQLVSAWRLAGGGKTFENSRTTWKSEKENSRCVIARSFTRIFSSTALCLGCLL